MPSRTIHSSIWTWTAQTMVNEKRTTRTADVIARDYTINLHKRLHKTYPFLQNKRVTSTLMVREYHLMMVFQIAWTIFGSAMHVGYDIFSFSSHHGEFLNSCVERSRRKHHVPFDRFDCLRRKWCTRKMFALMLDWINSSGPKEFVMSHTVCVFVCLANVMKMKTLKNV